MNPLVAVHLTKREWDKALVEGIEKKAKYCLEEGVQVFNLLNVLHMDSKWDYSMAIEGVKEIPFNGCLSSQILLLKKELYNAGIDVVDLCGLTKYVCLPEVYRGLMEKGYRSSDKSFKMEKEVIDYQLKQVNMLEDLCK